MLFSNFLPSVDDPDPLRLALIDAILLDCKKAFPDLHFELRLDRRIINAQSILLDEKRCVLIYGGIGLHPALGEEGLTFVFLHEAGHHLAPGPRLPFNLCLACDCVADRWATGEGAEILERNSGRRLKIDKALTELDRLMNDAPDQLHQSREISNCWNLTWAKRRDALRTAPSLLPHERCELM
jgi:hypothetical protein